MNVPVIVPLGNGSRSDNDELRILLRSLERNAGSLGTVYVVTTFKPRWLKESLDLVVVPIEDIYTNNKDGNLAFKTMTTIMLYGIEDFVWASDDNVLMKPLDLNEMPVIHNHRDNSFCMGENATKWQRRVRRTLMWAEQLGVRLEHNYECHCLQKFNGQDILKGMQVMGVRYDVPYDKTIFTMWRVVTDSWHDSQDQRKWKLTCESAVPGGQNTYDIHSKTFLGYNDLAFLNGLRQQLLNEFPNPSRFEL